MDEGTPTEFILLLLLAAVLALILVLLLGQAVFDVFEQAGAALGG